MSEQPIPMDASSEFSVLDQLIQEAWNRFAALGDSIKAEGAPSDGSPALGASGEISQDDDV